MSDCTPTKVHPSSAWISAHLPLFAAEAEDEVLTPPDCLTRVCALLHAIERPKLSVVARVALGTLPH